MQNTDGRVLEIGMLYDFGREFELNDILLEELIWATVGVTHCLMNNVSLLRLSCNETIIVSKPRRLCQREQLLTLRARLLHLLILLDTPIPVARITRNNPISRRSLVISAWVGADPSWDGFRANGHALAFMTNKVIVTTSTGMHCQNLNRQ